MPDPLRFSWAHAGSLGAEPSLFVAHFALDLLGVDPVGEGSHLEDLGLEEILAPRLEPRLGPPLRECDGRGG